MIQVNNKEFELFVDSKKIESIVTNLGRRLNEDYAGKDPILIGILNGSFLFIADLVRQLDFDPIVTFTRLASYNGTQSKGQVDELIGLKEDLKGKHVLIIEDIVDTGNTLRKIAETLKGKELQRAYKLSKNKKGNYKVVVKSDDRTFVKDFTL